MIYRSSLYWRQWTLASYCSNECYWISACYLPNPLKHCFFFSNYLQFKFDSLHSYPICIAILILISNFMLTSLGSWRILKANILTITDSDIHSRALKYVLYVNCLFIIFIYCYPVILILYSTTFLKSCFFLST